MIIRTKNSLYEFDFEENTVARIWKTYESKARPFDNNPVKFNWCSLDPYKAPEQIIGYSISILLPSGKMITTSPVETINPDISTVE